MPPIVAKRFGYALKRAQQALRASMDGALRPLHLTTPQYSVLCALEAEPGMSNARLARATFVTPQTMHGLLANLEKVSLLAREADPTHGRILRGRLTGRGQKVLARAHRAVAVIEDRMVASLGQAVSARMAAALTKCAEDLQSGRRAGMKNRSRGLAP